MYRLFGRKRPGRSVIARDRHGGGRVFGVELRLIHRRARECRAQPKKGLRHW